MKRIVLFAAVAMFSSTVVVRGDEAAAFIASEGGEELRLYQTTASKDFREIVTSGFTIHPYPAAPALDVDIRVKYKSLPLPGGEWSVSTLVFK